MTNRKAPIRRFRFAPKRHHVTVGVSTTTMALAVEGIRNELIHLLGHVSWIGLAVAGCAAVLGGFYSIFVEQKPGEDE